MEGCKCQHCNGGARPALSEIVSVEWSTVFNVHCCTTHRRKRAVVAVLPVVDADNRKNMPS